MIQELDEIAAMEFGRRSGRGLGRYAGPPPLPVTISSGQLVFGSGGGTDVSSLRPSLPSQPSVESGFSNGPAGMTFSAKGVGLPSLSYGSAPGDWRGAARQASGFGGTGRPGADVQYRPGGQSMLPPLESGGFGGTGRPEKIQMEPTRGVYPAMSAGAPITPPTFTGSGPIFVGSGAFATGTPMLFGKGVFAGGGPIMLGLCSLDEVGAMEFGHR